MSISEFNQKQTRCGRLNLPHNWCSVWVFQVCKIMRNNASSWQSNAQCNVLHSHGLAATKEAEPPRRMLVHRILSGRGARGEQEQNKPRIAINLNLDLSQNLSFWLPVVHHRYKKSLQRQS